jgi:F0F1-type ATP synthase assembly protein I
LNKRKTSGSVFAYSTIGIQLAATVTLFVVGGYNLDEYRKTTPVFTVIGAFLGMVIGFINLLRQLQAMERQQKKEINKERNKWL